MRRALLVLTLLIGAEVQAEEGYRGLSAFAAMNEKFPCDRYLAIVNQSERPAMSVLWGTFGFDPRCVMAFTASNAHRPHLVQVHISNETCRRNRVCGAGELMGHLNVRKYNKSLQFPQYDVIKALVERVEEIKSFIGWMGNPNTTWVLGTGLEDNYSNGAYNIVEFVVRRHWDGLISRNPLKGRARGGAEFLEKHGNGASFRGAPCIANEDGARNNLSKSRVFMRKHAGCFASYLWRESHQGRINGKWVPIEARDYVIPDEDLAGLGALLSGNLD